MMIIYVLIRLAIGFPSPRKRTTTQFDLDGETVVGNHHQSEEEGIEWGVVTLRQADDLGQVVRGYMQRYGLSLEVASDLGRHLLRNVSYMKTINIRKLILICIVFFAILSLYYLLYILYLWR